jgi:secreted trypsin-like serine protease
MGDAPQDDILVGITSSGEGCARANLPDIVTKVSVQHDWIICVMSGASNCSSTPESLVKNAAATCARKATSASNGLVSYNPMQSIVCALLLALVLPVQ